MARDRAEGKRLGRPRVEGEAVDRAHAALAGGASLRGAMQASGVSMAVVRRIKATATQQPGGGWELSIAEGKFWPTRSQGANDRYDVESTS